MGRLDAPKSCNYYWQIMSITMCLIVLIMCWQFGNRPEGILSWVLVFFCSKKATVRTPTPTMLRMPGTMNCKWIGSTGGALARSFVRHLGCVCIPKSNFDQFFFFQSFRLYLEKKHARRHNLQFSGWSRATLHNICMHVFTYTYTYRYRYINSHMDIHTYIYTCIWTYICTYIYLCMCIYMFIDIWIYRTWVDMDTYLNI